MRLSCLDDVRQSLRNRRTLCHGRQPRRVVRELLRCLLVFPKLLEQTIPDLRPRNKGQISVCTLVAYQPSSSVAFQAKLENALDPFGLLHVTIDGGWDLLWVEASEPSSLTNIRTLTCAIDQRRLL